MSLYLDASALVKRYVRERGSDVVSAAVVEDRLLCACAVTRVEVSAALARAGRLGVLEGDEAREAVRVFRGEWSRLVRVQISEAIVSRADELAWEHALRGYDAVQLACALWWRDSADEDAVFGTFDHHLWEAAVAEGMAPLPADLPGLLERWRS